MTSYEIRSVSLILFHELKGLLLCEEMRKNLDKSRTLAKHLIGGKLNESEDPFDAACREFCEEVPFNYDSEELSRILKEYIAFETYTCVSKKKNLQHCFYVVDVTHLTEVDLQQQLLNLTETFDSEISELISLFFWDGKSILGECSDLLLTFIRKFRKQGHRIIDRINTQMSDPIEQITGDFGFIEI